MTLLDLHAIQLTGTYCGPRNCAACSGAMALHAASGGRIALSGDQFRAVAGVSCTPGQHSPSGGLYISDVERVFRHYGHFIDYGRDASGLPRRWTTADARWRLSRDYAAVFLGDYDTLWKPYRASTSFLGDHSAKAHDLRASDDTVCWHDPLRGTRIRMPFGSLAAYWWKPTSALRGWAGWVLDRRGPEPEPAPPPPEDKLVVVILNDWTGGNREVRIAPGTYIPGGYAFNRDGTLKKVKAATTWNQQPYARTFARGYVVLSSGTYLWMESGYYAPDGKSTLVKLKTGITVVGGLK